MTALDTNAPLVLGIDIASDSLVVARSDSAESVTLPNSPDGFARLRESLAGVTPKAIVFEATGGYERDLMHDLLEHDLPAVRVNPANVRHFAAGIGRRAKTDAIDAQLLVVFGQKVELRFSKKVAENRLKLHDLITARGQLVCAAAALRTQIAQCRDDQAKKALNKVMGVLDKQIAQLNRDIAAIIKDDEDLSRRDEILQSVPGVGATTSAIIQIGMSELGTGDRREMASLLGTAPFNHDSGNHKGQRGIAGGRADVRKALYMPTVTAMTHNSVIKRFADRLKEKGKPFKLVVIACMRKLIVLINAMLRDNLKWDQLKVCQTTQSP